eukprot:363789-Chlamydomonas_euryale.AAC.1
MEAVVLPPGEAQDEWLAVNTVDFYNAIAVLFFTLEEYCTERTCEVMAAGGKYEYHWADGVKVKKPIRVSAPEYINKLFDWIEEQVRGVHGGRVGAWWTGGCMVDGWVHGGRVGGKESGRPGRCVSGCALPNAAKG